jgi:hypothetical protein
MRSCSYPPGVAAHIIGRGQVVRVERAGEPQFVSRRPMRGTLEESADRLIALLDNATEDERRVAERVAERRGRPSTYRRSGRTIRQQKRTRLWGKLTKSQVALWLTKFNIGLRQGGSDRGRWDYVWGEDRFRRQYDIDELAARWNVSRRMLFMALKLRKSGNAILIRAVAEGGVSLGDAIAHLDRDAGELRKAIRMVERREARSLKQALAV